MKDKLGKLMKEKAWVIIINAAFSSISAYVSHFFTDLNFDFLITSIVLFIFGIITYLVFKGVCVALTRKFNYILIILTYIVWIFVLSVLLITILNHTINYDDKNIIIGTKFTESAKVRIETIGTVNPVKVLLDAPDGFKGDVWLDYKWIENKITIYFITVVIISSILVVFYENMVELNQIENRDRSKSAEHKNKGD